MEKTAEDREKWFNAHESLQEGVTDFSHISATEPGHYIQLEKPDIVMIRSTRLLKNNY